MEIVAMPKLRRQPSRIQPFDGGDLIPSADGDLHSTRMGVRHAA